MMASQDGNVVGDERLPKEGEGDDGRGGTKGNEGVLAVKDKDEDVPGGEGGGEREGGGAPSSPPPAASAAKADQSFPPRATPPPSSPPRPAAALAPEVGAPTGPGPSAASSPPWGGGGGGSPAESPVDDSEDVDGRGDEVEEEEVKGVEEKKTAPRGKEFVRLLSSGSRGSEGSSPLAVPAAAAPAAPAADAAAAPAAAVALPSPSTRPPPLPAAAAKTNESKVKEAPDGCEAGNDVNAEKEDGGGEPSNKDKLAGRSNDGEQVESPADDIVVTASSTVGGFRPKMPGGASLAEFPTPSTPPRGAGPLDRGAESSPPEDRGGDDGVKEGSPSDDEAKERGKAGGGTAVSMRRRTTPPAESPVDDSEDVDGRGDEDEEEEEEMEVKEEKTEPRGKAFVHLLSSGSRGSECSHPPAADAAAAPAAAIALPSPSTRPIPPPAAAAAAKTNESKANEAPDGCEAGNDVTAEKEDGGGGPSNKDKLAGRSNDGEQVESPADDNVVTAPPTVGGFRPKMPRKRMTLIITKDPTFSTLEKQRPTEQEDPSKKLNQTNISREEYHSRVCLPRRRRLAARQRKVLTAMNKKAVGIYGSIPCSDKLKESLPPPPLANVTGEDRGSIARYFRGPSGGSSASRDSSNHLAGRGGGWESGARRRAVIASPDEGRSSPPWDLRDKAPMRGSFHLDDISTPVSFGRDHFSGLMPGMSPAIDLKALSIRNGGGRNSSAMLGSIGGRGDGRGGVDEFRDMMIRNPELWEDMMRTIKAGGGPMMGRGLMGIQGAGGGYETISDLRNIPQTPITALGDGGYNYGGTTNNADVFKSLHEKRKYPTDSLYGACGSVGMMDDDSSHILSKSPGNPKKTFLQRERVMDAEMRNHMREALLKGSSGISDDRNRNSNLDNVNFPFNRNTICLDTIDALNVHTSKSSRDENQASEKKTDPPAPKKSKKTISGSKTAQENSTASNSKKSQKKLNATIIGVMELPGKPKRPFSLYNLFFQLEREFILHEIREGRKPSSIAEGKQSVATGNTSATALTGKAPSTANPQTDSDYFYDPDIPARYSHLRLEKHWYSVGNKQKRKHRKTEGSCSFMDLTRMVSACWKDIDITDPYIKQYCQKLAKEELEVYKKSVDKYKKAVKSAELEARAKALVLIDEKGADLSASVDTASTKKSKSPKRSADEGAPERSKKLKRDVDEDTSEKSKETNLLEGRPFTADNRNPQHPDYGRSRFGRVGAMVGVNDHMMGGGDMSRFAEMARMGMSFPGFRGGGGRNDDDPRGMGMDGVARSSSGDRAKEATALAALMAEKRMVEKRLAEMQMTAGARHDRGGGGDESSMADARGFFDGTAMRMRDSSQMTNTRMPADDQRIFNPREDDHEGTILPSVPSDIQQKFAALAEAEARHRMQIEMQSGMIGKRNKGRGAWREMDRGGPQNPYQRSEMFPPGANGMRRMPQGSTSPRSHIRQMGQNSFPQDFGGPSSMQRKFMEQFGIDLFRGRGVENAPAHHPRDDGADIPQEQEFDVEVDQFLSTLKEEIKENRRKQLMRAGGSGGSSVNAPFMRAGISGNTASAPSSVGNNFGTEGGAGLEGMARLGGATGYQEPMSPTMMGSMMGMNAQMMDQMMRRRNVGSGGGSFGFGNNGIGPSPNQLSPAMMEELMRRQVTAAGNSQGGASMPALPFYGTDIIRRQQEGWGGGGGQGGDDPALPEYGWGDEGS